MMGLLWSVKLMKLVDFEKYIDKLVKRYAFPIKGKVIKSYTSKGHYYVDVRKMNLNESESEIIFPKVEVPKLWGVKEGGIFCIPEKGSIVAVGFYEGNINFPFVTAVMGSAFDTEHPVNQLVIKFKDTEVKIGDKINIKTGNLSLKELWEKLIDIVMGIITKGSPSTHVISPESMNQLTQFKSSEIPKILE